MKELQVEFALVKGEPGTDPGKTSGVLKLSSYNEQDVLEAVARVSETLAALGAEGVSVFTDGEMEKELRHKALEDKWRRDLPDDIFDIQEGEE